MVRVTLAKSRLIYYLYIVRCVVGHIRNPSFVKN